jgi:hypothetical protein
MGHGDPWSHGASMADLTLNFPRACFLSEGTFKQAFKVFNHNQQVEDAVLVM